MSTNPDRFSEKPPRIVGGGIVWDGGNYAGTLDCGVFDQPTTATTSTRLVTINMVGSCELGQTAPKAHLQIPLAELKELVNRLEGYGA